MFGYSAKFESTCVNEYSSEEENPEIYSITTSDGQVFEDKNPFWNSDFESLSCVNIDTVILKDKISC